MLQGIELFDQRSEFFLLFSATDRAITHTVVINLGTEFAQKAVFIFLMPTRREVDIGIDQVMGKFHVGKNGLPFRRPAGQGNLAKMVDGTMIGGARVDAMPAIRNVAFTSGVDLDEDVLRSGLAALELEGRQGRSCGMGGIGFGGQHGGLRRGSYTAPPSRA